MPGRVRDPLAVFHPPVRAWFEQALGEPAAPQRLGWPPIARGESTLILSPTGSGKTLAAFLWCLDRIMFAPLPAPRQRCRVLYVSPLKALAVDVERNLRAPLAGIADIAESRGDAFVRPAIAIRTGDTPASERARFQRAPADILITTPESLYLLLTSQSREALASVETVIVDEIHALVPTKRGAHLALSLERLQALSARPLQRIGLSATQRPLDEVARFLGGAAHSQDATVTQARPARKPGGSTTAKVGSRPEERHDRTHTGPAAPRRAHAPSAAAGTLGVPPDRIADGGSPQDEIHAEFESAGRPPEYRAVTVVDARMPKRLKLSVELPVEEVDRWPREAGRGSVASDSARSLRPARSMESGPTTGPAAAPSSSIWSSIHPRLLELVRAHTTTILFTNSRRLAERLAGALNDLAGETVARAHHGSLAREQRLEIEDALKAGRIPAIVATSSLELGIDMGAVDLVIQIEAPPSVASGLQRIGRARHQVDAVSEGIIFPKFRADLVASAAAARAMHDGRIESTRYPRNPLDVLAQQIVAMAAMDEWTVDALFATVRRAAPFASLGRRSFDGVLDMLSGRYPSDAFAELRPRLVWDRLAGTVRARQGARQVAVVNGGTIPDRGLYGVFLTGAATGTPRVGELDEEMVFESRVGDTFVLGASTWRIEAITHDRVLVSPAPGEPGRTPFWHGDRPGRPLEFGLAIARLTRELGALPRGAAVGRLTAEHGLQPVAAENLLQYLADQARATGAVPDDRTIVVERCRDELGDWRVCLLAPLGARVLAPWAMAAEARIRAGSDLDVETMWTDDGFVVRFPDTDVPPDAALLLPPPDEVETLVERELGGTSLFAARFREAAARALLLPRRRPGRRAPLWQQRKRAADLLAVAARHGSFPMLLETYRECLRDQFDMPALVDTLARVANRSLRVVTVETDTPSPFAASLLFGYTANFLYDGDAPLAERRAQALLVDQAELRSLIGDVHLRELLDADTIEALEDELQRRAPGFRARSPDGLHDLLLGVGDLAPAEIRDRVDLDDLDAALCGLARAGRLVSIPVAGETRVVAVEDAARYRDATGAPLPHGLPETLLEPVADPLGDLVRRFARTHGPFAREEVVRRYGVGVEAVSKALARLRADGRVAEGEFRPGRTGREWCDVEVLRQIRQRSLARLRREVRPVEAAALGRLAIAWQGLAVRRRGLDALLDVIEQLQGAPLAASILEREILPARLDGYEPEQLDLVMSAGEVVWVGVAPLGERDGRVALYLTDHLAKGLPPQLDVAGADLDPRARRLLDHLQVDGASFFPALHEAAGGGYPGETADRLWALVWRGLVTNDSWHPLRAFVRPPDRPRRRRGGATTTFRSRRITPPTAEGRWSLVERLRAGRPSATEHATALARQMLARHGLVTRETMAVEVVPGGFSAAYDVLKALEDSGRIRRGYFVAGLGAAQFGLPAAVDLLRSLANEPDTPQVVTLAATDPANPYGAVLRWPDTRVGRGADLAGRTPGAPDAEITVRRAPAELRGAAAEPRRDTPSPADRRAPTRRVGASVVLVNGALAAYLGRADRQFSVFLPEDEPSRSNVAREVARTLFALATGGSDRAGMFIDAIDGAPAVTHPLAPFLLDAGFARRPTGFQAAPPPGG